MYFQFLILELILGGYLGRHFGKRFGSLFWEACGVTQNSAPNSRAWPGPGQTLEKTQHSHAIWPSELAGAGLGPGPLIWDLYFGTPIWAPIWVPIRVPIWAPIWGLVYLTEN